MDAAPQFVLATEEELARVFPYWRRKLDEPVRRRIANPFTGASMEAWSWEPDGEPMTQPAGWAPDLSALPRTRTVAVGASDIPELVEAITGLDVVGQFEIECEAELQPWTREEFPFAAPNGAAWEIAGVRAAWVDALAAVSACPPAGERWQAAFDELKTLLAQRRPGQRLVLVDVVSPDR